MAHNNKSARASSASSEVSSESPLPCNSSDGAAFTARACSSFCNVKFATHHCPYCSCATCSWCTSSAVLEGKVKEFYKPPPPPHAPQPADALHRINGMWRHGKPSNVVDDAGVLVRMLDGLTSKGVRPWEPCPLNMWCAKYGGIWPSSLINQRHNSQLYAGKGGIGFVLAPPPLNRFFCIYPRDGNSMGHVSSSTNGCQKSCAPGKEFDCSFAPDQLEQALDLNSGSPKYNEVVIDAVFMKSHLPQSLLGSVPHISSERDQ